MTDGACTAALIAALAAQWDHREDDLRVFYHMQRPERMTPRALGDLIRTYLTEIWEEQPAPLASITDSAAFPDRVEWDRVGAAFLLATEPAPL